MGLKDYVVPSTTVTLTPTKATVVARGLNFVDLSKLINDHGPALILIYGRVMAEVQAGTLNKDTIGKLIQTSLVELPELMGSIIAIGVDEPELSATALKLGPLVQVEILSAIIGHTLISEAEVKKLVEIVTNMLEKAADLGTTLTDANDPSMNGSGASAGA